MRLMTCGRRAPGLLKQAEIPETDFYVFRHDTVLVAAHRGRKPIEPSTGDEFTTRNCCMCESEKISGAPRSGL